MVALSSCPITRGSTSSNRLPPQPHSLRFYGWPIRLMTCRNYHGPNDPGFNIWLFRIWMFRHTPLQRMSLTCPRPLPIRADPGKVQSSITHGTSFYVPGSRKSLLLSHYTPTDSNAPFLRAYHNARFCSLVSKILTKNPFTSSGCELPEHFEVLGKI